MREERPSPEPPRHAKRWTERAFLGFVLLTLATLVAVPILVNRRVTELRSYIQASEPTRTLVNQLQFNLVRELAALSELLLTGDESSAVAYRDARADEEQIFAALQPLIERLGPAVGPRFEEVQRLTERWHALTADEDAFRQLNEPADSEAVPREIDLFEEVLRATAALDREILRATSAIRSRIASAERAGLQVTVLLGLLALVAGLAAGRLARRARRFADESERRRIEAEAALEATARATEARERLLRGVTHDVKNPIGAAMGFTELLALGVKAPLLPEQEPLVAGVRRSLNSALAIISDLLDVARADSGGLSVERVETDLGAVAAEAVEDHRAEAERVGHQIHYAGAGAPLTVYSDPARIRQVLDNLLSNAIKYTPAPGTIVVRTELTSGLPATPSEGGAAVRVSDSGPGIPADQRESIFDEFTRIDEGGAAQGHGLGLAIARRISRLIGGELLLEPSEGEGATFTLWLPQRQEGYSDARSEAASG